MSTATTSSMATSICTVASSPDRSAAACAAKPPTCASMPSSHKGWQISSSRSRGRPAEDSGAAAACRCSTAAPAPYRMAATSAVAIIIITYTTLGAKVQTGPSGRSPIPPWGYPHPSRGFSSSGPWVLHLSRVAAARRKTLDPDLGQGPADVAAEDGLDLGVGQAAGDQPVADVGEVLRGVLQAVYVLDRVVGRAAHLGQVEQVGER